MDKLGKVFMLDDDLIILNLYKGLLENMGYQVFATSNAYQFLMYAKEIIPDVFVLDINMPVMNGWEVMHRIFGEDKLNKIPIVILSVLADKNLAMEKGAAHYLNKPLETNQLLEIIESYCVGNKKHDILLIEDFSLENDAVKEQISERDWSFFEVNDVGAAKVYLTKNMPKVVAVNLPQESYDKVRPEIEHQNVFYLKNLDYIDSLTEFIK